MSASWGLVRFKKTGNIYMCCYEGTTDILVPFICTPEECWDEKSDCYHSIAYCRQLSEGRSWAFPDDVTDLDECDVYSDYGDGFHWSGTGSESLKMIKDGRNPWNEEIEEIDGQLGWVIQFVEEIARS